MLELSNTPQLFDCQPCTSILCALDEKRNQRMENIGTTLVLIPLVKPTSWSFSYQNLPRETENQCKIRTCLLQVLSALIIFWY